VFRSAPAPPPSDTGFNARNDEPFAAIATAMDYDLRWVYRLHARGLAAGAEPQDKREH
jgi:hypothetical protein